MLSISCYSIQLFALALCAGVRNPEVKNVFKSLARNNLEFAVNLYKELSTSGGNSSVVVSPASLSFALSIISLGSRGETLNEIKRAIGFDSFASDDEVHRFFKKIKQRLNRTRSHCDLYIDSNLFVDTSFTLLKKFSKKAKEFYSANIQNLNFRNDARGSADSINSWISGATKKKISRLVDPGDVDRQTRLFLANAIYFRADWDQKFDAAETKRESFHVSKNRSIPVNMMHLVRMKLKYVEDKNLKWQVVELPYYKKAFSMILIKPNSENQTLEDIESRITADYINNMKLREEFVTVSLPRFKLTSDYDIDDVLRKFGLSSLFERDAADLRGMTKLKNVYVSKVVHKAIVEVNEEGSEAAAATGVLITTRSERFSRYFVANCPFIFLIKDNKTGIVLFIGRVVEPESS